MPDILNGKRWRCDCSDALTFLRGLPDGIARTCVTSPPYFGLRDYGVDGQIGLEPTPTEFVSKLVDVFREVRRVLTKDGTCWVNMGDSYNAQPGQRKSTDKSGDKQVTNIGANGIGSRSVEGIKPKDLIGVPWLLAFALRDDGWYLRQDIIWHKPNPMPESVKDRCTKAHEMIYMLAKSPRYYFDAEAIQEPVTQSTIERVSQSNWENQEGSHRANGGAKTNGTMKAVVKRSKGGGACFGKQMIDATGTGAQSRQYDRPEYATRNKRSVWTVCPASYKGAHFATFPAELITPCILAGSAVDDIVLEPFSGSGTTLATAVSLGRRALGCELNPNYMKLIRNRMSTVTAPIPGTV